MCFPNFLTQKNKKKQFFVAQNKIKYYLCNRK